MECAVHLHPRSHIIGMTWQGQVASCTFACTIGWRGGCWEGETTWQRYSVIFPGWSKHRTNSYIAWVMLYCLLSWTRKGHYSHHKPQLTMAKRNPNLLGHGSQWGKQRRPISDVLCVLLVARSEGMRDRISGRAGYEQRARLSVRQANVVSRPMYFVYFGSLGRRGRTECTMKLL